MSRIEELRKKLGIKTPPDTKGIFRKELRLNIPLVNKLVDFGFCHIDPKKFEELILSIFEVFGFKGQLTPVTGDEGIDIILNDPDKTKIIVQCKCYAEEQKITPKEVREFVGSMVHANAKYGFFVTSGSFSEQAADFCKNKEICLINGSRLKKLFLLAVTVENNKKPYEEALRNPTSFIFDSLDSFSL